MTNLNNITKEQKINNLVEMLHINAKMYRDGVIDKKHFEFQQDYVMKRIEELK